MNIGEHIPPYLLCERFVKGCKILDLFPADEKGCELLAESCDLFVAALPKAAKGFTTRNRHIKRVSVDGESWPFAQGSFDIVLALMPSFVQSAVFEKGGPPALPFGDAGNNDSESRCYRREGVGQAKSA